MSRARIPVDWHVAGLLSADRMTIPAAAVRNASIADAAGILATKVQQQPRADRQIVAPGTTVTAKEELLRIVYGATGTILRFAIVCPTVPVGGDLGFTVDLHKSRAGGAFATVLDAPLAISVAQASADLTVYEATLDTDETGLEADDLLQVEVAITGSTGTQGQGLLVSLVCSEDPA